MASPRTRVRRPVGAAAQESVEEIHRQVAVPIDEIVCDVTFVTERLEGVDPDLRARLEQILTTARGIKEVIHKVGRTLAGTSDVILLFCTRRAELEKRFAQAVGRLDPSGGLWIAWPKRASGVATDLSEDVVRGIALAAGLVDNKVCAVDETWSGLRCVVRLADRPKKKR